MAEQQYYMKLTEKGLNAYARAVNTNRSVDFSFVAVGDGNGQAVKPDSNWTALVHEVWRDAPILVEVDEDNPRIVIVEMYIPHAIGGFTVREVGLFDSEGTMLAVGNYPDSYKPTVDNGAGVEMRARFMIEHTNAANTVLKIDPAIVMASREYAEKVAQVKIDEHNDSQDSHDAFARKAVGIIAGSGLQGGGDLSATRTIALGDWEGKSAEDVLKVIELAGITKELKTPEQLYDAIQKFIADRAPDLSPFVLKTQIATVKESGLAPRLATDTEVQKHKGVGLISASQLGLLNLNIHFSQASGKFTVPEGVTRVFYILTGGGGSGASVYAQEACGGSAGGTCLGQMDVKPGQELDYIIGAGGIGPEGAPTTTTILLGKDGGDSFLGKIIAHGGKGGDAMPRTAQTHPGDILSPVVAGGKSTGGLINLSGGVGEPGFQLTYGDMATFYGGHGGDSFWGGGGCGTSADNTYKTLSKHSEITEEDLDGGAPGAGGGSRTTESHLTRGGNGADGCILIVY